MKSHKYFERDGFDPHYYPTIYNAIRYDIINVKLEDTRRVKYKAIYECNNNTDLPKSKAEYSINNRPEEIDKCLYFGHFELDNVLVLIKENTNVNISQ